MASANNQSKALIVAGFITLLMITGIANLSFASQRKSVLDFDKDSVPCALNICSLI